MRLFIAIELPAETRAHLVRLRDHLKPEIPKASFTGDEKLHITLKFLGEAGPDEFEALIESLDWIRATKLDLWPGSIQCFPNRGPIRVVAAGFEGDVGALGALHAAVEQRCQHLGFEPERRAYRPHATLARGRPTLPSAVRDRLGQRADSLLPGNSFTVSGFALFQSKMGSDGSQYIVMKRFTFDPNIY